MTLPNYLKSHFLVVTIIFALLLLGVIFLIILPSAREISSIRKQVLEERVRLEKLYVRGQLQKKVRENYNSIIESADWLDNILLKENQELQYITALESIAEKNGIKLKINVGESVKIDALPFSALNLSLDLTGRWPKIVLFLNDLENLPYYTNIKEIVFARQQGFSSEPVNGTVSATVSAQTLWLIP